MMRGKMSGRRITRYRVKAAIPEQRLDTSDCKIYREERMQQHGSLARPPTTVRGFKERQMIRRLIAILVLFAVSAVHAEECVILLHGLARTAASMNSMAEALDEAGFSSVNI